MRLILSLVMLSLMACTKPFSGSESNGALSVPVQPPTQQKFFGYYASQMDGIGIISDIDELKDKSNFVFIASGDMENRLQKCRELGMKAMVNFSWLLFDDKMKLYADWQNRVKWATDIMDKYQDVIIANYPADEPYMNAAKFGIGVDEMYQALEQIGQFFKARYPQMAIAVIFSAQELNGGFRVPPSFDWFGMDCYGSFFWCERNSIPGHYEKIKAEIAKLENLDSRLRYLMAVPPAGWEIDQPKNETNHLNQVPSYRKFVKEEPKMKVVIPFIWQTFGENAGGWYGARTSPRLKEAYVKFFQDFMTGHL